MKQPQAGGETGASAPAFGALLRRYRTAAGMAQETLAELAGISVQAISALERGVRQAPQRQTLLAILDALELDQTQRGELQASAARRPKPRQYASPFQHPGASGGKTPPDNLPAPLSAFLGRDRELTEAAALLRSTRLLTVTGMGGIGKTRFGIALAASLRERYPDGIRFVELAQIADPALVPSAIMAALGLREEGGRRIELLLIEHLRDRATLLFLDDCEHVGPACASICRDLLRSCPDLQILTTSRAVLGIGGEVTFRLSPLAERDGVELFVDRARALSPTFLPADETEAQLVGSVVRRLDGIPLAIELAAARINVLSLETLCARLDNRFRILTGGGRGSLHRHATLRAAIDWSYDLLGDDERKLFMRLAIFAGSWTLEAAEQICSGGSIEESAVLDLLSNLVDKSLVQPEQQGEIMRFRYLDTVRSYALEKLAASADSRHVRARFVEWFAAFAEEMEPWLFNGRQLEALQRIGGELDNLRSALDIASQALEPSNHTLRLLAPLSRYWFLRNSFHEARTAIAPLLERTEEGDPRLVARTLISLSGLFMQRRDFGTGWEHARKAKTLAAQSGDAQTHVRAWGMCALAALQLPPEAGAEQTHLALLQHAERLEGERPAIAYSVAAIAALRDGDFARGAQLLETALSITRRVGDSYDFGTIAAQLGLAKVQLGDDAQAAALFFESAEGSVSRQCLTNFAQCAEGLGYVAARGAAWESAAELFGAAQALRDLCAAPLWPHWRELQDRYRAAAVERLGEEGFAEHYAFGNQLARRDAHASIARFRAACGGSHQDVS